LSTNSRIAFKEWPTNVEVGQSLTAPHPTKTSVLRNVTTGLWFMRTKF